MLPETEKDGSQSGKQRCLSNKFSYSQQNLIVKKELIAVNKPNS